MENLNVDIQDTDEASDPPERCVHLHDRQGGSIKHHSPPQVLRPRAASVT